MDRAQRYKWITHATFRAHKNKPDAITLHDARPRPSQMAACSGSSFRLHTYPTACSTGRGSEMEGRVVRKA